MSDEMLADIDQLETIEWLDAAKGVVRRDGGDGGGRRQRQVLEEGADAQARRQGEGVGREWRRAFGELVSSF